MTIPAIGAGFIFPNRARDGGEGRRRPKTTKAYRLLVLPVVKEELGTAMKEGRVGVRGQRLCNLTQLVEEPTLETELDGLRDLSSMCVGGRGGD